MTVGNFWDSSVWAFVMVMGLICISLLFANFLKQTIGFLKKSLVPSAVLGGLCLLIVSCLCKLVFGVYLLEVPAFSSDSMSGIGILEMMTYHCLAIGFIGMTLRDSTRKFTKKRSGEIFDSGVLTVSGYLIQGTFGLAITIIGAKFISGLIPAAGVLLPMGYGQSTGQALNFGSIYESGYGFVGGKSFGLTIAAMGFLTASIIGVIYLNILRKKNPALFEKGTRADRKLRIGDIEHPDELPLNESIDRFTVQLCLVFGLYAATYGIMYLLGRLVGDGLIATIYGFNFLLGALVAVLFKQIMAAMRRKQVVKHRYVNNFMMDRISGTAFDIMIVAGIGAIRIDMIRHYIPILLILGIVGAVITFWYVRRVCYRIFPEYPELQFLGMFGMLTGTTSTGMILLREADRNFESPVSENLVYLTLPAIIFGFPIMLFASYAPTSPTAAVITLGCIVVFFLLLQVILFRRTIFKGRKAR